MPCDRLRDAPTFAGMTASHGEIVISHQKNLFGNKLLDNFLQLAATMY